MGCGDTGEDPDMSDRLSGSKFPIVPINMKTAVMTRDPHDPTGRVIHFLDRVLTRMFFNSGQKIIIISAGVNPLTPIIMILLKIRV